ncbi:MAG TPA: RNA methyltransferase [Candidatus Dormibacteraeota bacterium]|nr:RNA methyltransferase [Candidatus Dormibacteraeota bacterium]
MPAALECRLLFAAAERDRLSVVLVSTRNPLNIGAAARAMSNFGFHDLRVVHPYDAAFREARSAVGASALLASAQEHSDVASAVADATLVVGTTAVRHRHLHHTVRRSEEGAKRICRRLRTDRVALLFGSEKFGLSNDDLSHCHWLMRIPTEEENISMNLGQAVAVCLYEFIRETKAAAGPEKASLAAGAEIERITELLAEALRESGFLDRRRVADADQRVRRLVRRLHLPRQDAVMWLGIFRQIVWKLRHPEGRKTPSEP